MVTSRSKPRAPEQHVRGHPRSVADHRRGSRPRHVGQRHQRQQRLGGGVAAERRRVGHRVAAPAPLGPERRVGLAVGSQEQALIHAPADDGHRGGPSVAIESRLECARHRQLSEPVDSADHEVPIQAHAEPGPAEHHERPGGRGQGEAESRALPALSPIEQQHADRHVEPRARHQHGLESHQRQQQQPAEYDADDRAQCIPAVDRADGALAQARADQRPGDERQGHAGAERGGKHDDQAERVACGGEPDVAVVRARERAEQCRHPAERRRIERKRGERQASHHPLHDAERAERIHQRVGAAADPERAQRDAQNERGQHELERVRRAAEHERKHPDPGDLIEE